MSSMVERVCRHTKLDIETSMAVAKTLEHVGSVAEAVFCFRAMGLEYEDIAYALNMAPARVWVILHNLPIASLLEAGVMA